MEPVRDPYVHYSELLNKAFEKIKKYVPKKYKQLRDLCTEAEEKVKTEKDSVHDANKYFLIIKLALDTKITKLMEHLLYIIQKLISYGFLDGDCDDNCIYAEDQKPASNMNGRLNRKLIDGVVEAICSCVTERDNQVQLQIIKVLLTIVTTPNLKVHERSLLEAFRACYHIHITSTNQINQNTAKASLTQMINIVFKNMDVYSGNISVPLAKLQQRLQNSSGSRGQGALTPSMEDGLSDKSLTLKGSVLYQPQGEPQINLTGITHPTHHQTAPAEEEKEAATPLHQLSLTEAGSPLHTTQNVSISFSEFDQFMYALTQRMVDDVCLYHARVDAVKDKYISQISNLEKDTDQEERSQLEQLMNSELENIQISAVPPQKASSTKRVSSTQSDDISQGNLSLKTKKINPPQVDITNELGVPAGKFGWCIMCRGPANLYCKDTRYPVCAFECKEKLLRMLVAMEPNQFNEEHQEIDNSDEAKCYFNDALMVFKSICKLCQKEVPNPSAGSYIGGFGGGQNSMLNTINMRSKVLGLELILAVVQSPGTIFKNSQQFINVIKETLCELLLKQCVSNEKTIFSLSLSIFYCIFEHFREHLKQEIVVFLEQIFLRILDSGNSIYHHKYLILNVFDRISQNTHQVLEIFYNYDCDYQQKDILQRMIDSLSKIAQGKFQKSEHQTIITAQEEYSLRLYALQIVVQMLRNINRTIDTEHNAFKLAGRENGSAGTKKESEHHSDDEDSHTVARQESDQHSEVSYNPSMAGGSMMGGGQSNQLKDIQKTRQVKNEMVKASIKFNLKPKNGINYLLQTGHIPKDPIEEQIQGIVQFLKTTSTLDKTKIGEYLGEDIDLNKKVLYQYVESFHFTNVRYVESLKRMLSGFRLPGEGQKVDRIMEKFGDKFFHDNPESFGSAECIYLLSYATMMLQTSIHNPQAQKCRMSLDDFVKMTKGINSGKDLEREFLAQIYESVEKEPFTLTEDEDAKLKLEGVQATSLKRKQDLYMKEAHNLAKRGATMMKEKKSTGAGGQSNSQYILINDTEPIRPMFENTWSANLAVFSVLLEESDDNKITDLCIEGFMHAIKISGFYQMDTERDAFVSSLQKFTQIIISGNGPLREIKEKNLECIRKLLELATYDGNFLRKSWYYVLDCVSKIDYMYVLGTGAMRDQDFFNSSIGKKQNNPTLQRKIEREQMLHHNSQLIVQNIDMSKIDLIIQKTVQLEPEAIIDFITALIQVSSEELKDLENPRKFSLQKLVEVADFNMGRIRFVWQKIWQNLSEHFNNVGQHNNLNVALYAIDSLRQLADKFLMKEEFGSYHFQKDFLKPFNTIMLANLSWHPYPRQEVKEFIIMAVANMCMSKSQYLKSGWSVVIDIFLLAAQDNEEHLLMQSFEVLKQAVRKHFNLLEDNIETVLHCLFKYAQNSFTKYSMEALDLIEECAKNIHTKKDMVNNLVKLSGLQIYERDRDLNNRRQPSHQNLDSFRSAGSKEDKKEMPDERTIRHCVVKRLWLSVFAPLNQMITERRRETSEKATMILFRIFNNFGTSFSLDLWREILNEVVLSLLDDIAFNRKTETEFIKTTFEDILEKLNILMAQSIAQDPTLRHLIPDYIDTLGLYISNITDVQMAQIVIKHYKRFIEMVGRSLSANQWNAYVTSLQNLFQATVQRQLISEKERYLEQESMKKQSSQKSALEEEKDLDAINAKALDFNQDACFTKCIVQLLLIGVAAETVEKFYDLLSLHNLFVILECLDQSYRFAREFNQELGLRLKLWNDGFMADLKQLPGLTAQERESISTYLKILFRMYFSPKDGLNIESNSKKLFDLCSRVLKDYCLQQSELVSIMNSKREENSQVSSSRPSNESAVAESEKLQAFEDDKNLQLSNLHENELERQLQNMTPIVSNIILANLMRLSEDDLHKHVKEVGPLLIDLSLCSNYEIRAANRELLTRMFDFLTVNLH